MDPATSPGVAIYRRRRPGAVLAQITTWAPVEAVERFLAELSAIGVAYDAHMDSHPSPDVVASLPSAVRDSVEAHLVDADDGCYESGRTHEPGLHHPTCNAIRNGGRCDVGRGADQ